MRQRPRRRARPLRRLPVRAAGRLLRDAGARTLDAVDAGPRRHRRLVRLDRHPDARRRPRRGRPLRGRRPRRRRRRVDVAGRAGRASSGRGSSPSAIRRGGPRWPPPLPFATVVDDLADLVEAADVVVNAVVGFAGLPVTSPRCARGKRLALANKESLIAAGPGRPAAARDARRRAGARRQRALRRAPVPALVGDAGREVARILLTASGGPFRGRTGRRAGRRRRRGGAGPSDVADGSEDHHRLEHADEQGPRGDRGPRAVRHARTTRSRSSSTRSRSSTRWSSSPTARRSPSSACPTCACRSATPSATRTASPRRSGASTGRTLGRLDFEPPDLATFRCLGLAYQAGRAGGTAPAWLSAANEVAVEAFLAGAIRWDQIADVCNAALDRHDAGVPSTVDDVVAADRGRAGRSPASGAGDRDDDSARSRTDDAAPRYDRFRNEVMAGGSVTEAPPDDERAGRPGGTALLAGHRASSACSPGWRSINLWMFVFVVGILVSVFLHETGHFVTARMTGMKATQFFLGFGPRLWSFRRGETEYGVRALPLGAFVRIIGMNNLDDVPPADEARTYRQQSYPRRMLVITAGSLMHLLIAVVLLFTVYAARGRAGRGGRVPRSARPGERCRPRTAGIETGDVIVSIDGAGDRRAPTSSATAVRSHEPGDVVAVVVERDGERADDRRRARRQHRRGQPDVRHGPARRQQPRRRRVAGDVGRRGRGVERHRPVPGGVGVDQGRRPGPQPGQHLEPPDRRERRPGDAADHGRRRHPGQRHVGETQGFVGVLFLLAVAERVRRRVQHVPAAAARRRPRRDRHLRAGPRARTAGATSPTSPS